MVCSIMISYCRRNGYVRIICLCLYTLQIITVYIWLFYYEVVNRDTNLKHRTLFRRLHTQRALLKTITSGWVVGSLSFLVFFEGVIYLQYKKKDSYILLLHDGIVKKN